MVLSKGVLETLASNASPAAEGGSAVDTPRSGVASEDCSPETFKMEGLRAPNAESPRDLDGVPNTVEDGLPSMLASLKKADGGSNGAS